jgi:hypothetical protein
MPAGYEVIAVIPVGRPAAAAKEGPKRKEISEFVHLDQFGKPWQA